MTKDEAVIHIQSGHGDYRTSSFGAYISDISHYGEHEYITLDGDFDKADLIAVMIANGWLAEGNY